MRILVACTLDPLALARLGENHEVATCPSPTAGELAERVRDREVLVVRGDVSVTKEILDAAPELRLIVRGGSGVERIDLEAVADRGIELARIPQPGARAAAELTFGLMLALARHILPLDAELRRGSWVKQGFEGALLSGRTLGVVGVGSVGGRVAELAASWGMRVVGCVARTRHGASTRLRREGVELASLEKVVEQADFLSLHLPLDASTEGLFDEDRLACVKPGAFLINTAHAALVDARALYHALRSGRRLRGAAFDVRGEEEVGVLSPLRHLPNVILTPRIGAWTVESERELAVEVARVVQAFDAEPRLAALGA